MTDKKLWVHGVTDTVPEELLDGRIYTECNVIGLIWKDPMVLDEVELSAEDFLSIEGRFYYGIARELRKNKNINELNEIAVLSNLS